MAVRIRKTGSVIATFPSAQQVDISHLNDSVNVGDGTNLFGPLHNVGGILCFPVYLEGAAAGGLALDATLTGGTARTKITDGVDNVGITTVGAAKAIKVDVVSSVGGSAAPAFTDDAAATPGTTQCTPIGGMADEVATDSVDEGDVGIVRMTLDRMLYVKLGADGVGLSTSSKQDTQTTSLQLIDDMIFTDDAAFTPAVSKGAAIGAQADEVGTDSVDEGDFGVLRMTLDRMLYVKVGTSALPTGASTLAEQQSQTTALGAIQTSVQLIDDVVFVDDAAYTAATHKVFMIGGQFQSAPNVLDDGDAGTILLDTNHAVQAVLRAGTAAIGKLAANSGVDIGDVDVTSVTMAAANAKVDVGLINAVAPLMGNGATGTGSLRVTLASDPTTNTNPYYIQGGAAVDGPRAGNPLPAGGSARLTTLPALVSAAADTTDILTDGYGRLLSAGAFPPGAVAYQAPAAITNTTETTIVTSDANNCLDIIWMSITNNSDVQSIASLRDATLGTVRGIFLVPARGGIIFAPPTPFAQTTKANNWTLQMTTTSTSTNVMVYFGKRPT